MVQYKCKRCGYTVDHKGNFYKHLIRKNPCKVKYENISIETLLCELEKKCAESALKCAESALKCAGIDKKCAEGALGCAENALKCAENTPNIKSDNYIDKSSSIDSGDALYLPDEQVKCKYCNKIFKKKRYLNQHYRRNNCKKQHTDTLTILQSSSSNNSQQNTIEN